MVAVWPPTSVAVTVVPDVRLGTLNVQLNDPVPLVVKEPLVHIVIVTPSKTRDFNFIDTENPVPETVTVAPTKPVAGLTVILGVVTVNARLTLWPPTSAAVTVVPDVPLGTSIVQLNDPVPLVVKEPLMHVVIATPSKTSDFNFVETENPVPATFTVAPMGPWPGLTVSASDVTVNL
ncbi:MAG: hypothetical protein WA688_04765 [Thermoplasmata archaeon]